MTTVGTIDLIAKIDTSQYKRGAAEIDKTNQNIAGSAEKASSKTSKAWNDASRIATAAIVTFTAIALKSFVDSASEIQSLRASFLSLTGSVKNTNAVMTTLADLSKRTAFQNKDIQAAGRNYLAAGVSIKNLNKVLSATADIAGATGADLGQLTLPLTQAVARGKLQTQDFYQILNAGAGALRKPLTELAGKKGFGSLAEALEKGEITSSDLLKVMQKVTKQGGFAFEGALKQSQTFAGRMSNLQEAITKVGLSILGVNSITGEVDPAGAFSKLSDAVSAATDFLTNNGEVIKQVGTVIGIFLTPAIIRLGVEGLIAGGKLAAGMLLALGPVGLIATAIGAAAALIIMNWKEVSKFVSGVVQGVVGAWDQVSGFFSDLWKGVTDTVTSAVDAINSAISSIVKVAQGVWNSFTGWVEDNKTALINLGIVIGTILLPLATKIAVGYTVALAKMAASFTVTAAKAVAGAAKTSAAWVVAAAKTSFAWITQTLPKLIAQFAVASAQAVVNAAKTSVAWTVAAAQTAAGWAVAFGQYLLGLARVVIATAVSSFKMVASLALALGPIGLIGAALIGLAAIVINNWDTISKFVSGVFNSMSKWAVNTWNAIVKTFSGVGAFFGRVFGGAYNAIRGVFSGIGNFFRGVWNGIVNIFGKIGTSIGNAIGGAFKGVINGVIKFIQDTVNGIIKSINAVATGIDKALPGDQSGWRVPEVHLPRLAQGGIVTSPTLAMIGEGGESEAVIPLSKLSEILGKNGSSSGGAGDTYNITLNAGVLTSKTQQMELADLVVKNIEKKRVAKGIV